MSDEQVSPDPTSPDLHGALVEIRGSIESLAHRFRRVALSPSSLGPRVAAEATEERDAFTVGEEILAIPSSGLEPSQVFSLAMDRVARVLTADRAMLFTWDALASRLVPRAGRGFRRDDLETISIKAGEGLVGQAFQDERLTRVSGGAPRIVEDPFLALFPVSDAVAVPVRSGGSALGILYAGRRAPRPPFSEAEVLLLLVIADRVGNALGQRDAIETTRGHIGRLRELEVFLGHVLVGQDMGAVLARACEVACRLAEARIAAIGVPGGTGGLALAAGMGLSAHALDTIRVDSARGLTGEMFATQRPAACRDIQGRAGSEDDFLLQVGLRACLAVPVRLRRQTVGALYVGDPEARDFSADQIEAVQVLASMLALGMENNRLYGEVQGALQGLERAQEQLVQTSSARAAGAMAGGIANEFNNVLAIVLGKTRLGHWSGDARGQTAAHVRSLLHHAGPAPRWTRPLGGPGSGEPPPRQGARAERAGRGHHGDAVVSRRLRPCRGGAPARGRASEGGRALGYRLHPGARGRGPDPHDAGRGPGLCGPSRRIRDRRAHGAGALPGRGLRRRADRPLAAGVLGARRRQLGEASASRHTGHPHHGVGAFAGSGEAAGGRRGPHARQALQARAGAGRARRRPASPPVRLAAGWAGAAAGGPSEGILVRY